MLTADTTSLPFAAAILIGWLGGVHCLGMCGGIVSALSLSVPATRRPALLLAYNAGRCLTYTLLGALAGLLGYAGVSVLGLGPKVLFALANLLLIGMGLYLMGWPVLVRPLEQGGQLVWRHIEPLARRFFPVTTPLRALVVGLAWGFLPCGLVYSALATAIATSNPLTGALWMAGFALGTLPNLLLAGWMGAGLLNRLRQSALRWLAGALVAAWGLYGMAQLLELL
ncbi:sulfite exporter TauE/SafE family protein [Fluviibacter phosphoraccumulans]|uniref:sulfite exporter TauE/SafE family protein n=1 Tax=Fluviibacter phosphoraccumulans TaxID=1751046 RepID=UPI0024E1B201|nr:sulfite exporter TauE/SafE family protein [Fluviibacter phosphoraccumulans]